MNLMSLGCVLQKALILKCLRFLSRFVLIFYRILIKGREKIMININYLPEEPPMEAFDVMAKYFDGDWRQGKEIRQIKITHRYYQVSINETKF